MSVTTVSSYGAAQTVLPGQAQGAPAAPQAGMMARLRDRFDSIGLALGIGAAAKDIRNAFRHFDQDKSKDLDANEFTAVSGALMTSADSFRAADANGNQRVSLGEFKRWVTGTARSEFAAVDANGDRVIDPFEFATIANRNPGLQMQGIDTSRDGAISFREYLRFRVGAAAH